MSGDRETFLGNAKTTALGFALPALFRLFIANMLSHNYKYIMAVPDTDKNCATVTQQYSMESETVPCYIATIPH